MNLGSGNNVADDETQSAYQIGAGGYFDKLFQWDDSYLVGSVMQFGTGADSRRKQCQCMSEVAQR